MNVEYVCVCVCVQHKYNVGYLVRGLLMTEYHQVMGKYYPRGWVYLLVCIFLSILWMVWKPCS